MNDLRTLINVGRELHARGEAFVVATVVGVRGSSYRRPGARMLLTSERWVAGSVSGGCVEEDVVRKIGWRLRDGRPVVVTYDATDEDARVAFGLGCNGAIDVLMEKASTAPTDALMFGAQCVSTQMRGALATVTRTDSPDIRVGARTCVLEDGTAFGDLDGTARACLESSCRDAFTRGATTLSFRTQRGAFDAFVELLKPPPRLFVFGGGRDAVAVVTLARTLGWDVTVCTPLGRPSIRDRFAHCDVATPDEAMSCIASSHRSLGVVMNHDFERDAHSLAMLLASRACYVGVLGPRDRTNLLLAETRQSDDARLHAPVGLAIGAETPEEIAVAIIAEAQAALAGAPACELRTLSSRIHQEVA